MILKEQNSDLLEALDWLDQEAELHHAMGNDEDLMRTRQIEVQLRRMAREAGYNVDITLGDEQ